MRNSWTTDGKTEKSKMRNVKHQIFKTSLIKMIGENKQFKGNRLANILREKRKR